MTVYIEKSTCFKIILHILAERSIVNIDTQGSISDTQNMAVTTQRINILFYGIHAGYFHRMHIVSSSLLKPLLSVNIFIGHCQKRLSSRLKVFCLLCTLSPLFESRLSSLLIGNVSCRPHQSSS